MNIQENIANKKERELKIKNGELFIIDSFRNGVLVKSSHKTIKEISLLLLTGVGVMNGELMEYVR